MARIELDNLSHSYSGAATTKDTLLALKPLTVTWQQGGAYALLGPSGCGKTTLLNIISGLVRPSGGRVLFDDVDVTDLSTERRNIAQVFQFPVIYDTMTVRENLAFPLRNRGAAVDAIKSRVAEIADMLDLTSDLDRRARGLTADAKQKISLGRGLVRSDVAAILFDEPLTVIDPQLKWRLRSKLKALHHKLDLTMIYVTHDQTEALTFADTVVVMHDGRIVQTGSPSDLFATPEHTFVGHFIGSPGMNILAARVGGAMAYVGAHAIALAKGYPNLSNQSVEIGIRPEFTALAASGGVPVTVDRIEDHGRVRYARAKLDGQRITLRVPDGYAPNGASASAVLEPKAIHIYVDGCRVPGADQ
jgi:glycerol transport system ATP-binding protein